MRQDENMPILLKTQVESADKTPVTACRARVGGLCHFCRPAERVLAQHQKTGRCANVREHCGHGKREKERLQANFGRGRSRKRRSGEAGQSRGVVRAPRRSHLPAVRAVSGIYEGVPKVAKNSPRALQNEKSPPFQGKQRGSNENYEVNTEKW